MQDYIAIANLKARYCAGADYATVDKEAAFARLVPLFAEHVTGDYGLDKPLEGGTAMARFLCDAIAGNSQWMVHNIHSPLIGVDCDKARGQWTVNVRMKRQDDTQTFVFGRYTDEFVKLDGVWKIASVSFRRYE